MIHHCLNVRKQFQPTVAIFVGQLLQFSHYLAQQRDEMCSRLSTALQEPEHLAVDAETLLRRLFAEDTVRVFPARPIALSCQCSHPQISAMLINLGEDELRPVLIERGRVDVTCEYCGKTYGYTDVEVRALFAAIHTEPQGQTLQ